MKYTNKKTIIIFALLILINFLNNYKKINSYMLNIKNTNLYNKIKEFVTPTNKNPYTFLNICNENHLFNSQYVLINEYLYYELIPVVKSGKNSDIYKKQRKKLILLIEYIIKYKERIPVFQEIIQNPNEGFIYNDLIYNKFLVLFFFTIIIFCFVKIVPNWLIFLITNIGLINSLFYPNHKIFLNSNYMKVFYLINLSPVIIYIFWYGYKILIKSEMNNWSHVYIVAYLILKIFFLKHVKNIPNKYENLYDKMINIQIIEKNNEFYLIKSSYEFIKRNIVGKL